MSVIVITAKSKENGNGSHVLAFNDLFLTFTRVEQSRHSVSLYSETGFVCTLFNESEILIAKCREAGIEIEQQNLDTLLPVEAA